MNTKFLFIKGFVFLLWKQKIVTMAQKFDTSHILKIDGSLTIFGNINLYWFLKLKTLFQNQW